MSIVGRPVWCALFVFLVALQGCDGRTKPGFRKAFEIPKRSTGWQPASQGVTRVKLGPDSVSITVRWSTVRLGSNRGISHVTVDIPEHRESDQFVVGVDPPYFLGTSAAPLEIVSLKLGWNRNATTRPRSEVTTLLLQGDGQSMILSDLPS